jgi:hypothetical protein
LTFGLGPARHQFFQVVTEFVTALGPLHNCSTIAPVTESKVSSPQECQPIRLGDPLSGREQTTKALMRKR